tara:strand:+ start:1519 stop:3873 length:2355 start_codon:yes stop_codon:yes gene_type:complete
MANTARRIRRATSKLLAKVLVLTLLAGIMLPALPVYAADPISVQFDRIRESPVDVTFLVTVTGLSGDYPADIEFANMSADVQVVSVEEVKQEDYTEKEPIYLDKDIKEEITGYKDVARTKTVKSKVAKFTEKDTVKQFTIPLASTKVYEVTIQTGTTRHPDGGWGSKGVLVLDINGTKYFDMANSSWWDATWLNRIVLSFNTTTLTENLITFPVTVFLTPDRVDFGDILAGGADIRFIDDDDATALPYEITRWSDVAGSENATIVVRVPQINTTSNFTDFIYMYYNNAVAGDAQDRNAVWATTASATGVWPLYSDNNSGATIWDSTGNGNNSTSIVNATYGAFGRTFAGTGKISMPNTASLSITSSYTVSTWFTPASTASMVVASKWTPGGNQRSWAYHVRGAAFNRLWHESSTTGANQNTSQFVQAWVNGTWYKVDFTYNGTDLTAYVDGAQVGAPQAIAALFDSTSPFFIASDAAGGLTAPFTGTIGEVRIYDRPLSAEELRIAALSEQYQFTGVDSGFIYYGGTDPHPEIGTLPASGISMDRNGVTAATLSANLSSLGGIPEANVWFEYGLTAAYGSTTANTSYTATGTITDTLPTNLTPGATYHFRVVGQNAMADGTDNGTDADFTFTMPTATTGTASIAGATITLNGDVTNAGVASDSNVYFEYGPTVAYGSTTTVAALAGVSPFSDTLSSPASDTTLFYRSVAQNGAVQVFGAGLSTGVPSATGASILKSLLRVFLAAAIVIGVIMVGARGGGVALLLSSIVGVVAFVIIDTIITSLF